MDLPISVSTYDTPFFKEYQFDHSSGKDVLVRARISSLREPRVPTRGCASTRALALR